MSTTQQEIDQIMEVCENLQSSPDATHNSSGDQNGQQNNPVPLNTIGFARDGIHKMQYLYNKLLMDQGLLRFNLIK